MVGASASTTEVPVLQLSFDQRLSPTEHLAIGRTLAPLGDEGVLMLGSGNITRNLSHAMTAMRSSDNTPPPWAMSFDAWVCTSFGFGPASLKDSRRWSSPTQCG